MAWERAILKAKYRTKLVTNGGQPFDPKVIISTHVANTFCSISFGMNFKNDDPRYLDMLARFNENLRYSVSIIEIIKH